MVVVIKLSHFTKPIIVILVILIPIFPYLLM